MKQLILIKLLFLSSTLFSQNKVEFLIFSKTDLKPINNVEVYEKKLGFISKTNNDGNIEFSTSEKRIELVFFSFNHMILEKSFDIENDTIFNVQLLPLSINLNQVNIQERNAKIFNLAKMKDIEETTIFAGKKAEKILVNQSISNLASNNARQIYNQISGINIYQNDDAGLQLNIGGRGLDPSRTSNFNTRQNGYDISADVLGYPESYYSPPAEGLKEIQIVRGAASLQYGTQFGGLVNFILKKPNRNKITEIITRNTIGSNKLFTNFTSVSQNNNNVSLYSFFNYKKGNGFRPNSHFESKNFYIYLENKISNKTTFSSEFTYLKYLAKQAGGLTDEMFYDNPLQSNRSRNWFQVDWFLYNFKLTHKISKRTNLSLIYFGLDAKRNALGFRTNRVNQGDPFNERDLIKGNFKNNGFEARLLSRYSIFQKSAVFLVGSKLYNANNSSQQGPGSSDRDADFNFYTNEFPFYSNQSFYKYPNKNISIFSENIFYLSDKLLFTPGIRYEHINTKSDGYYNQFYLDGVGNVMFDTIINSYNQNKRSFILLGAGLSYKWNKNLELYANVSQNYRSVTFADISIINPAFVINPNIKDENGITYDFGFRGEIDKYVSFDATFFQVNYNNRIGFIPKVFSDGNVKSERGNIGDAVIFGMESIIDFNLKKVLSLNNDFLLNYFLNTSYIKSKYIKSEIPGVEGNQLELIPEYNIKSGFYFGYKNITSSFQYTFLSNQFTDASNAIKSNISGVIGEIPSYSVIDCTVYYDFKNYRLEAGINNLLNSSYFTRRATGYPGPGIIPSPNRNYYLTFQIKI